MTYQNNNNRLNPEAVSNLKLNPQATPVDKLVKHQLDTSNAESISNIAQGLMKLGKGMVDIEPILKDKADEAIETARSQAGEQNKQDWAKVSRNVAGYAKFNPYIKKAFREANDRDIKRAAEAALAKYASEKMSPEEYKTYVDNVRTSFLEGIKNTGSKSSEAAPYIVEFEETASKLTQQQYVRHQEYQYKNRLIKASAEGGNNIATAMYNSAPEERLTNLSQVLSNSLEQLNAEGVYKDDQAACVISMIEDFVVNHPDLVDSPTLEAAMRNVIINGQPIQEIIPNYNVSVHKKIRDAKRLSYEDKRIEWEERNFDKQMQTTEAMTEYFEWWKDNKTANGTMQSDKLLEIINKHGLEEYGTKLLDYAHNLKTDYVSVVARQSDPTILADLQYKAAFGTLTSNEVAENVNSLSSTDTMTLMQYINKQASKELTELRKDIKDIDDNYFSKDGAYYREMRSIPNGMIEFKQHIARIERDVSTGERTPAEAKEALDKLTQTYRYIAEQQKHVRGNITKLIDGGYRKSREINSYVDSVADARKAFTRMGMVRTQQGGMMKDTLIESMPSNYRSYSKSKHLGYDISGVYIGKPVYSPLTGTVVGMNTGDNGGMGNYIIVQSDNTGNYCLIQHLKDFGEMKMGSRVNKNTVLGHVGNTGRAAVKGSLHVELWNQDFQWISASEFVKGNN